MDVHMWEQKHSTTTTTKKQQHNNCTFECLYSMFANHHICVVLGSNVHQIGGWSCPKFMHKFKYT